MVGWVSPKGFEVFAILFVAVAFVWVLTCWWGAARRAASLQLTNSRLNAELASLRLALENEVKWRTAEKAFNMLPVLHESTSKTKQLLQFLSSETFARRRAGYRVASNQKPSEEEARTVEEEAPTHVHGLKRDSLAQTSHSTISDSHSATPPWREQDPI